MKYKNHIIKCSDLHERRCIILFLLSEGYTSNDPTLRDIDDPEDYEQYPWVDVDDEGEVNIRTSRERNIDNRTIIEYNQFDYSRGRCGFLTSTGFKLNFI